MTTASETKTIYLPKRVFYADWATVEHKLEISRTGAQDQHGTCYQVTVPANWTIGDSDESPWQKRLINGDGKHVAKLFYKPQGGTPAMQLMD